MGGVRRASCAIPECPRGNEIFPSIGSAIAHVYVDHGVQYQGWSTLRTAVMPVDRRSASRLNSAFKRYFALEMQERGTTPARFEESGGSRDEHLQAFTAGWKAARARRPGGPA